MTVTIENLYTGDGSTTDRSFTFPYLDTTDIKVSLDGVATTAYSLLNATTVRFNSAPANGVAIRIYRDTAFDTPKATFYPGSAIRANDLNDNTLQNLYVNHESNWKVDRSWLTGDPTVISTESWYTTDDTKIATTKAIEGRIDTKIDSALTDDIAAGSSITITDNSPSSGKVTVSVIAATGSNSGSMSASDKSKLDGIESNATADQTNAEIRAAVEAASDSNVFTDADHSKLNAIEASATADQTASEIKTLLQSDKLTDSEIATGTLDGRYYTETEVDANFYKLGSAGEIASGETWTAADTKIATTAAIDARITDLVDDVGGFVPISNETSFPNANPDVNNGAGTLVSIKALSSNLTSDGSGVATIANGTVGNSTVTINGLANSTTYAATFGMIVETTSTLNTYTFHRLVPKATEVTTVAGSISNVNAVGNNTTNINTVAGATSNISTVAGAITNVNNVGGSIANVNTVATNISSVNDFADRYRVASSDPSSNNDTGDLVFNTTSNELRVYNGSAWQGGVTATGDLLAKSGGQMTGNLTFSGSQTVDGRDVSSDGTKLDGIATNANNYTHPNHTGEVTSSADGATVVVDNIIDEANLKVSNSPTNGQFLSAQSGNTGGLTWATVEGGVSSDAQYNTLGGTNAGDSIASGGTNNTVFGYDAGTAITTGDDNTLIGYKAGEDIGAGGGSKCTFIGSNAGLNATYCDNVIAIGKDALGVVAQTGNWCIAIGDGALKDQTASNDQNIAIGYMAGQNTNCGSGILIGDRAGQNHKGQSEVIAIGNHVLQGASSGSHESNYNIGLGYYSGKSIAGGDYNFFCGYEAGKDITDGDNNILIGKNAGTDLTGQYTNNNIALGFEAMQAATAAYENIALGYRTLNSAGAGSRNIGIGTESLRQMTSGQFNVGIGNFAGNAITTGEGHICIGKYAGLNLTTGQDNVFIGTQAGDAATTPWGNTGVGVSALTSLTTGASNVAIGRSAATAMTTGGTNTCLGYKGGQTITTGSNNTCLGHEALPSSATVSNEVTIGDTNVTKFRIPGINFILKDNGGTPSSGQVLTADGSGEGYWAAAGGPGTGESYVKIKSGASLADNGTTTYAGYWAGNALAAGNSANTLFGYQAGYAITSGDNNTCIGAYTGLAITTGEYNICMGYEAGDAITTGTNNIALGHGVLGTGTITGHNNIGIGKYVLKSVTTGNLNTAIGNESGDAITTGAENVLLGSVAGGAITTGNYNVCIGNETLLSNTTSGYNTAVGNRAGVYVTGANNTSIGAGANDATNRTGSNNTVIGYNADTSANDVSNEITLGNTNVTKFRIPGINFELADNGSTPSNGQVLTMASGGATWQAIPGPTITASTLTASGISVAGSLVTALGTDARTTGSYSTFLGYESGKNLSSNQSNAFFGYQAGKGGTASGTPNNNVGIGYYSLLFLTSGAGNTCMGSGAGISIGTGNNNTFIGYDAAYSVTSGSNNTAIGKDAGFSGSPSGNIGTSSNIICLGDDDITDLYCADTSISSSDKRDKTDITDFTHGLKWVEQLKPVTYRWDKRTWYAEYNDDKTLKTAGTPDGTKKKAKQHIGFLAQDVLAVEQADGYASKKDDMLIVNLNEDETGYGLKYERLVPVLVNAIKELSAKVTALEAK